VANVPGVSGGGLIFAAILVGWAVFLLPQWLRRDPEVELDSHGSDAADPGATDVPEPAERGSIASRLHFPRTARQPRARRHRPVSAARRRRQVLVLLAGATVTAGVAPLLVGAPAWLVAVPGVLLVAYLVLLVVAGRRVAAGRAAPRSPGGHATAGVPAAGRPAVGSDVPASGTTAGDEQATGPIQVIATPGAAVAVATASTDPADGSPAADDSWAPVSVPLPTYVTAPKARRTIRSIDLSGPGSWTSGRLAPDEAEAYAAAFAEGAGRDADEAAAAGAPAAASDAAAADAPVQRAVGS
jgi:hypothetical protein